MWNCKHCGESFPFDDTSTKANHSRWRFKNPKRNDWDKESGSIKQFGKVTKFNVECEFCGKKFQVEEKEKLFPQKEKYYCSSICSHTIGAQAMHKKYYTDIGNHSYRKQAWIYHEKKCIVCGESKIVAVHHYDHNHSNKNKENLIPLCPTHHGYVHSKYKGEVLPIIEEFRRKMGS